MMHRPLADATRIVGASCDSQGDACRATTRDEGFAAQGWPGGESSSVRRGVDASRVAASRCSSDARRLETNAVKSAIMFGRVVSMSYDVCRDRCSVKASADASERHSLVSLAWEAILFECKRAMRKWRHQQSAMMHSVKPPLRIRNIASPWAQAAHGSDSLMKKSCSKSIAFDEHMHFCKKRHVIYLSSVQVCE